MRWLGICAIVLAVAQAGRSVGLVLTPTLPAPQIEPAKRLVGPVTSEDLRAWVLETNVPPSVPPSALYLRSGTRSPQSVANRNSNPLNIKLGLETRRYVDIRMATISDIMPLDGGRFLKFDSPVTGFRAAIGLLSTASYADLTLGRALRRWSNNGFGAEIVTGTRLDAKRSVPNLDRDDLGILLSAMAAAEGYKSSAIADEIKRALSDAQH